jgi:hypothetical protein
MNGIAYISVSLNYAGLQHTYLLVAKIDVKGVRELFHRITQVILHMSHPPFGSPLLVSLLLQNLLMQLHYKGEYKVNDLLE